MKNIAIIPARSGSKGLPDKNIMKVKGKPLIQYTIEAALKSGCFDTVMVSTDSEKYAEIAREGGADVPFLRSSDNAGDYSSSWDVIREVLARYEAMGETFDYVALLQPTSPLRDEEDIQGAFAKLKEEGAESITSIVEVEHPIQWCFRLEEREQITELATSPYSHARRQDLDTYYRENGAIFVVPADKVMNPEYDLYQEKCFGYVMKPEKSVDIDNRADLEYAEFLLKK
ncbi:MAG: acylneuraminate cytidylyltransferase family protein [Lachnospiraceae bacterium]|nr:acylneuraminate cytidylyltransferase family protein [Lachnospiraceae bacterium]